MTMNDGDGIDINNFHGDEAEITIMEKISERLLSIENTPSEDQEGSKDDPNTNTRTTAHVQKQELSEAEMQDLMDPFTYIMQFKFLSGEDHEHLDYSKIDEDLALDEHCIRESN
ncbi:hypothetical protein AKJ16_DCAP05902 [Drosera capensis]